MNSILPEHGEVEVVPLEEGFSNKTYQISWQQQPRLVLRISDLNSQAFAIERAAELAVCQLVSAQRLGAKVLWHNEQAIVWEFLPGQTLAWDVQHTQASLMPICQSLSALHQLPSIAQEYDVYRVIADWLAQLAKTDMTPELRALTQQTRTFYQSLKPVPRPAQLRLCHNDLNPKNVLLDGSKAWLIDWEAAGMNDPLFDLAVLAHVHHLTAAQLQHAYQAVVGSEPMPVAFEAIDAYRKAYVVRELVWLLLRHQLCGSQDLDCLQWYHALLNDPVFNPYFKAEPV
ncbi:Homoserine kinase [Marinomonas aquimarina]|uniref:Homoserine kinase n=2 Tax=Marinomonas aquimarina TaxID=295068 RepID=A0A1A8T9K9_9GAMM|nr:Homoserine kinase [Marinomonas aquimarina]